MWVCTHPLPRRPVYQGGQPLTSDTARPILCPPPAGPAALTGGGDESGPTKSETIMTAITCPNCKATVPDEELVAGWCEKCGKPIPAYVLTGARGLRGAADGGVPK